eukprot:5277505-Amphidinium_carterae.1
MTTELIPTHYTVGNGTGFKRDCSHSLISWHIMTQWARHTEMDTFKHGTWKLSKKISTLALTHETTESI